MNKVINKLSNNEYRVISMFSMLLLMLTLIPIIYMSFFIYATGDDLLEGAALHQVIVNHGSVFDFFRALFIRAKIDYLGWEGNWSSIILWCLEPSIWGERFYIITTYIALASIIGGSCFFINYFFKTYLHASKYHVVIICSLFCMLATQYMPFPTSGLFWYTGIVNYLPPYAFTLCSLVWLDKYLHTHNVRHLVYTTLAMTYISGAGYMTVVLSFELLVIYIIIAKIKHIKSSGILLPMLFLIVGFIISAISPGNAVRGGESYTLSVSRAVGTIVQCYKLGIISLPQYLNHCRFLIFYIPFIFLLSWEMIDLEKIRIRFKHCLLVVLLLFSIYCSTYAPEIYSLGKGGISGCVYNIYWLIFLLFITLSTIYIVGFLKTVVLSSDENSTLASFNSKLSRVLPKICLTFTITACLISTLGISHFRGNSVDYIFYDFIRLGLFDDYRVQRQEQIELLNDPEVQNVVLYQMNHEQGPFMYFAFTENPDSYANSAARDFYGKESVIAIPRMGD